MTFRRIARLVGAAILTTSTILLSAPVPFASAQPCPDVDVVFARGTGEPPGVGGIGQAFVDALRSQAAPKSVDVYPVNYPASGDFGSGIQFAGTVIEGNYIPAWLPMIAVFPLMIGIAQFVKIAVVRRLSR